MPWREASPMDQRTQFIADHLRDVRSITELCALYGVSRKTGYKWIDRYVRHGPAGLEEASRRPRRSPNQTSEEIVSAILDARRRHPRWGGKKLLALLHKRHPRWSLPGRSTAGDILSRHGMVPRQRRRRRLGHPGKPTSQVPLSLGLPGPDVDRQRRGQADLHAAVPRVRAAAPDSQRQRRALRHDDAGPLVEALGVVGPPRDPAGAHRARAPGSERPA